MAISPKLSLLFLSLVLTGYWACSSSKLAKKITTGIVKYDIELDLTEEGQAMAESFGKSATTWFNATYLRLQKNSGVPNEEFYITNLANGTEKAYIQFRDKKYAVQSDPRMLPQTGPVELLNDTKIIAGYKCKKAVASMGSGQMEVYYSEDFGINYCPYIDVPGFALEYTLVLPFGLVTYRATEVQKGKVSNDMINPPSGFQEVTYPQFQQEMANNSMPTKGDYHFAAPDMNGTNVDLSTDLGKVVVLNFWFSSCPPCKVELPYLNQLVQNYQSDEEVRFYGITFDSKATVKKFLKKNTFDFTIIPDARAVTEEFGIIVYPTTIVLDRRGKMVHLINGGSSEMVKELTEKIEEAKIQ